jgi:predicted alpha/beta-fold hydrolase
LTDFTHRSVLPYRSPWWLPGGHAQTISATLRPPPRPAYRRNRWETPDGDFIDVDFAGSRDAPLLVLFHGLEGSSDSHYARAMTIAALVSGRQIAIPHFRGCSGEANRLPRAYHSGDTEEIDWILHRLAEEHGIMEAMGVSLGANALLKWMGERESEAERIVRAAAAVSTPFDLAAAGAALDRGLNRMIYVRHFLSSMKRKAAAKLDQFPDLYDRGSLNAVRTLREFDNLVTAPLHGFRDVDDYWKRASSAPWLTGIRVPTLALNALNDPFLPASALRCVINSSEHLLLEFPADGGHVGFPGSASAGGPAWLPARILEFFG